ncbi:hypothetical protein COCON_G00134510 [Conger conger]|uniref:CUB domain-containing protein 1 n=1 Tax=Conger conger TaxID=82655 RepID=A0A9Q1DEJ9_CONCO|nr:CUB domain-containing protein 1 [Conger conger]KAJ8268279.1 hypothetical protein COCON_G00134510 [Conger conger]
MNFSMMNVALLVGTIVLLVPSISECQQLSVSPEGGATVILSTSHPAKECSVCIVSGVNGSELACSSRLTLQPDENVVIQFNCSSPDEAFTAVIQKIVECTKDSCSPAAGETQPSLFTDFQREFLWQLTGAPETQLALDFPQDGLQEITSSETCPDQYLYTVSTQPSGDVRNERFCRNGPISHIDLPNEATVSLQVPGKEDVNPTLFQITSKPLVKRSRMMVVAPDLDTIIYIRKVDTGSDCTVCSNEDSKPPECLEHLTLRTIQNVSVDFTCPQPQDTFTVEINRDIVCNEKTCNGDIVVREFPQFPEFNRTFTWDLRAPNLRAFRVDFLEPGMKQVLSSESCPDQLSYNLISYPRPITIGTFCRSGPITSVQVIYKGRLSLAVPGGGKVNPDTFKVLAGSEIKKLAVVNVKMPSETAATELFSANYPDNFPDDDLMMWDFSIPSNYNYSVNFLKHTAPPCLKKDVMLEYQREGGKYTLGSKLTDIQPQDQQGSFTMSLTNCETDRRGNPPGLSLHFQVSVVKSSHPVLCAVDLQNGQDLTIDIEKITTESEDTKCEMKMDGVLKDKITVLAGTSANLVFQDCPSEELQLTISKTIGCHEWGDCPPGGTLLDLPALPSCLPVPMQSITWHLMVPEDGTVDLWPSTFSLRQSLPGQECQRMYSVIVAEENGTPFGEFCPKGAITKVQIHSNVSVTVSPRALGRSRGSFFNVTFSREITESYIFTLSPEVAAPAVVSTPNWPDSMKPYSTASWIVMLPDGYKANLFFTNLSQPKCSSRHTNIRVQTLGSLEEMFSRRSDETQVNKLEVPDSFFLNTSNCLPEDGEFSLLSKITLKKKKSNNHLAIILGAVGGLLLLMLIVLAAVCVVIRKKKKKMAAQASIYIGKGNIFMPNEFPKTRANNESHIYTDIEDTMVYGHLLPDPANNRPAMDKYGGPQMDVYRPFAGASAPVSSSGVENAPGSEADAYRTFLDPSQSKGPSRPHTPVDRQESLGFVDRRMVANELNTFRSNGEVTPQRHSTVDAGSQQEAEEAL